MDKPTYRTDYSFAVMTDAETGLFHGEVYRLHPTPSGFERWILAVSSNKGYPSLREAAEALHADFPEVKPFDLENLDD